MKKEDKLFKELGELEEKHIKEALDLSKNIDKNRKVSVKKKLIPTAAAVVLIISIILPNTSYTLAKGLSNIPVIGNYFKVVTIRDYKEKDNNLEISVKVPEIENEEQNENIDIVNKSAEQYTKELVDKFKEEIGDSRGVLDITYEVVTNTDEWFALKIISTQIQASGAEKSKFYNINKETGEYVKLSDIMKDKDNYVDEISNYIKKEMIKQIDEDDSLIYFIKDIDGEGFDKIDENQEFYINSKGNLVISFDEYEVAPGYMGMVEFEIPKEFINNLK